MKNTYKLAVIGKESSILLFRSLGCETHGVFGADEAQVTLEKLANAQQADDITPQYAVVFVEEEFFKTFPEDLLEKLAKRSLPAVVPVPSPNSTDAGYAFRRLSSIVERAVGTDILN